MAGSNKRPLEMEEPPSGKINLTVLGPDGCMVDFRIRRDTPLRKLLMTYCENKKFDYRSMTFTHDGKRVLLRRTADEIQLENGDQIDAWVNVHGGSS